MVKKQCMLVLPETITQLRNKRRIRRNQFSPIRILVLISPHFYQEEKKRREEEARREEVGACGVHAVSVCVCVLIHSKLTALVSHHMPASLRENDK